MMTRKKKIVGIVLLILVVLGVSGYAYIHQAPKVKAPPVSKEETEAEAKEKYMNYTPTAASLGERKEGFYTILLVGTMDHYNTDTILLCTVDTKDHKVNAMTLYRDTMLDANVNNRKLNAAYGRNGIEGLCKAVKSLTGIYPDFYAMVDIAHFIKIVDILGGVEYDVPYRMYHKEDDPQYTIDLQPGEQMLDGSKALQLVRFRGTAMADIDRTKVQRDFLITLAKKVKENFSFTKIQKIAPTILESLDTNMSLKDMLWFYLQMGDDVTKDGNVNFFTIPIEPEGGVWKGRQYVFVDQKKALKVINESMNPYVSEIKASDLDIIKEEDRPIK